MKRFEDASSFCAKVLFYSVNFDVVLVLMVQYDKYEWAGDVREVKSNDVFAKFNKCFGIIYSVLPLNG